MKIPALWQKLVEIFLEKNSHINLSAIRESEWVYIKHILDSIQPSEIDFLDNLFMRAQSMLDIWTWWWFPLLPLAQKYPHLACHGLDARKKKTVAVQDIATQYWLKNVVLHRWRAEDKKLKLWKFDLVTARWVTYADQLFQWCFRHTKRKGRMIRRKQFTYEEDAMIVELSNDQRIIDYKTFDYTLPWQEWVKRRVYCMQKR